MKGENIINRNLSDDIRIIVQRISITVKFPCHLFLQYSFGEKEIKSKAIKINPKQIIYELNEEIKWYQRDENQQQILLVFVKLISSKGVPFTAGMLSISTKDIFNYNFSFKVPLTKSVDPLSFCQCKFERKFTLLQNSNAWIVKQTEMSIQKIKLSKQQKQRDRQLQLQLESLKAAYQLLLLKEKKIEDKKIKPIQAQLFSQIKKNPENHEQSKKKQQYLTNKIEILQSECSKVNAANQLQKEMIALLQHSQQNYVNEKSELKTQIKALERDLEQKRVKIRQIEAEKLNLMMVVITTEKEIALMKERVHECLSNTYSAFNKLLNKKHSFSSFQRANIFQECWKHDSQSQMSFKFAKNHKLLTREDPTWLQVSQTFRQQPNCQVSTSSAMDNISISNINSKNREQISLLNSELFVKESQTVMKLPPNQILKGVTDSVREYCGKIDILVRDYRAVCERQLVELRKGCKKLREQRYQFQLNQYSLLDHLEELEGGLEQQLEVVANRENALANAFQNVQNLEKQIEEKNQVISQLQNAFHSLNEDHKQLKKEFQEMVYINSKKEQEIFCSLKNIQINPGRQQPFPSRIKTVRHKKDSPRSSYFNRQTQNLERMLIEYKEKIHVLQLELIHQRHQNNTLKQNLINSESNREKISFALKFREKAQVLNQSIEVSIENTENSDKHKSEE